MAWLAAVWVKNRQVAVEPCSCHPSLECFRVTQVAICYSPLRGFRPGRYPAMGGWPRLMRRTKGAVEVDSAVSAANLCPSIALS